ncbi:hypothetical protein [Frigoribacterium sp. NBH87]|nr:hypothetical protein [Frigoribacterium sp. NBH87]
MAASALPEPDESAEPEPELVPVPVVVAPGADVPATTESNGSP